MKTKLLLIASAAFLSLGLGSANAAPVQLTTAQMDNVSAGSRGITVRTGDIQVQVAHIGQFGFVNFAVIGQSQQNNTYSFGGRHH